MDVKAERVKIPRFAYADTPQIRKFARRQRRKNRLRRWFPRREEKLSRPLAGETATRLRTACYTVGMTAPKTSGNGIYLDLTITDDDFDRAQGARSHSGRCMIAQSILAKFGKESRPIVDSDFIRLTNPDTGDRLFYRTPPSAAAALISFDAGIRPAFPLRIRASVSFERRARRQNDTPVAQVRAWAASQPQLARKVSELGPLSTEVIVAYRETHPGSKVHSQRSRALTSKATVAPKMVIDPDSQPPVGNLANASVPESRRRTWGSRKLTATLIEQGWIIPDSM